MYVLHEKGKVQGAWRFILQGKKESSAVIGELRVFILEIFIPSFAKLLPSSRAGHELHMNRPPLQHKKASSPSTEATPELQILVLEIISPKGSNLVVLPTSLERRPPTLHLRK